MSKNSFKEQFESVLKGKVNVKDLKKIKSKK